MGYKIRMFARQNSACLYPPCLYAFDLAKKYARDKSILSLFLSLIRQKTFLVLLYKKKNPHSIMWVKSYSLFVFLRTEIIPITAIPHNTV